jgi:hypothetical protein
MKTCSTPFGVPDFDTAEGFGLQPVPLGCSTPFGVTDFDTARTPRN